MMDAASQQKGSKAQKVLAVAARQGWQRAGALEVEKVYFHPEYYPYCEENLCGNFGINWACPRAPGDAEHWNARRPQFGEGVLVQSFGRFGKGLSAADYEPLREKHHWAFLELVEAVRAEGVKVQGFSADTCLVCESCTCPGAPCRHPDKCFPSVAGVGLDGEKLCKLAGLPYGNFEEEVTFLGLLLIDK